MSNYDYINFEETTQLPSIISWNNNYKINKKYKERMRELYDSIGESGTISTRPSEMNQYARWQWDTLDETKLYLTDTESNITFKIGSNTNILIFKINKDELIANKRSIIDDMGMSKKKINEILKTCSGELYGGVSGKKSFPSPANPEFTDIQDKDYKTKDYWYEYYRHWAQYTYFFKNNNSIDELPGGGYNVGPRSANRDRPQTLFGPLNNYSGSEIYNDGAFDSLSDDATMKHGLYHMGIEGRPSPFVNFFKRNYISLCFPMYKNKKKIKTI